jgi:hypothetical protein
MRSNRRVQCGLSAVSLIAITIRTARADDGAKVALPETTEFAPAGPVTQVLNVASSRRAEAATFGILGVVRESKTPNAPATAWWLRTDLGPKNAESGHGGMWSTTIEDAAGGNGLRLSSVGEGGGSPAKVISRGVATLGEGEGVRDLDGFDHRGRGLAAQHVVREPVSPDGRVPADVIQRIVRENFGRLQACYDIGARLHPALQGRVAVKFVIDRAGSVAMASDEGSDLPDSDVVACVVRVFDMLAFPASRDSLVTVVYPIVFTAGSGH